MYMLKIENRLYGKLSEKLAYLLENTKALSVETELCKAIVNNFTQYSSLIEAVKSKISVYLNSNDPNGKMTNYIS